MKIDFSFAKIYKWVLVLATLTNLSLFFPLFGWPTVLTPFALIFSFAYIILFGIRIGKMPRSNVRMLYDILLVLFILSFLAFAVIFLLTYYKHSNPNILEDDLASLDWLIPLMLNVIHIAVLAVICACEAFLLKKYPIDQPPQVVTESKKSLSLERIGLLLLFVWILAWFGADRFLRLGYFVHALLIIALLIFAFAILKNQSRS